MSLLARMWLVPAGGLALAQQPAQLSSVTAHVSGGTTPRVVEAADFDGDGFEDLLVAHADNGQELVLLRGDAQRQLTPLVGPSASGAIAMTSGRINTDSIRDVAYLRANGNLVVRLGAGAGTFGGAVNVGVVSGGTGLVAGELNLDGKLDLLAIAASTGSAQVFTGNGLGGFTAGPTVSCGPQPAFAQLGNLNGDAYRDLAVANLGTTSVSVLFNGPTGFAPALTILFPQPLVALDLADLDGDGHVDIVAGSDDSVAIALGDGTGSFAQPLTTFVGSGSKRLVALDATGDGLLDVVVSRASAAELVVLENRGLAGFAIGERVPVANEVFDMNVGDFDGDGLADIGLVTNRQWDIPWIAWGPQQSIHRITRKATALISPTQVRAGDIDGDGDVDLVCNGSLSGAVVYLNSGGSFGTAQVLVGTQPASALELADLDGDGRLDILSAYSATGFADVYLGRANGLPQLAHTQRCGVSPEAASLEDFNGDGVLDCAVVNASQNNISVRLGIGGGLFTTHVNMGSAFRPFDLAALDVDADGDLDLAVSTFGSASPGLVLLSNDGSGTFATAGTLSSVTSHQVHAADADADGDDDLLLCSPVTREIVLLLRVAPLQFVEQRVACPSSYPRAAQFADLDADGDLDVAVGHAFDNALGLVQQVSPGLWSYVGSEPCGTNPMDIAVADLDADAIDDLAVASLYTADLRVYSGAHARFGDVVPYCTATMNSLGCTPELSVVGVPSASSPQACTLLASSELNQRPGLLFYGSAPAALPFGSGWRCVASPLRRTPAQLSGGSASGNDCSGSYAFDWNALVRSGADPALTAGSTHFAQFWSRDGASSTGFNFTSAVQLVIAP
ncbi:MAG: VCBS repeat-containing protein [Planctomycetes bacterium]|nr:VCBS repeat-containing protein [Planctomycetota bacterium]